GQRPVGLYVLNAGVNRDEQAISEEIIAQVREEIGPVAAFKSAFSVSKLPKTRSGKVLRATLRKIANGEPYPMPPTIEDPGALDAAKAILAPTN
ncbi:MAG: propionyl-CoA synthetase, partial [Pseudomonadota bacterium]